jgi:selenocysteine lyase/cysteine desulfurase
MHVVHMLPGCIAGAFSAASNVTGVVADVDGITQQLHNAVCVADSAKRGSQIRADPHGVDSCETLDYYDLAPE